MDGFRAFELGRLWRLPLGLGLVATALLGCGPGAKGDCPALGSCGGDPTGNWQVGRPEDVCEVLPVRPMQPVDVTEFANHTMPLGATIAPPQPNPVVVQQTTSGDWCSSLVLTPSDNVENANLWHDAPELVSGTMVLAADHTYLTSLNFSTKRLPQDRNSTHFAPRCLLANGGGHPDPQTGLPMPGTCAKLQAGLNKYYLDGRIAPTVPPNFTNVVCGDARDGGCDCTAEYTVTVDDSGAWTLPTGDPTTLLQDSTVLTYNGIEVKASSASASFKSTFCAGTTLQLTGPNGGSLFGMQGVRTMVLSRM